MTQENRQRICPDNPQEGKHGVASVLGRCSGPLKITAVSNGHTLWLDLLPPAPIQHRTNKTPYSGVKGSQGMRSHALSSSEFVSPSLWLFHRNLCPQILAPGYRFWTDELSEHNMQGANRMSWQWVLTVLGLQRAGQIRGLSRAPRERNRGTYTDCRKRGCPPKGLLQAGVSQGYHLWEGWILCVFPGRSN